MDENIHTPVLLQLVTEFLRIQPAGVYVDCTLGMGGHTEAIAEALGPEGKVIGIDRDEEALELARSRLKRFGSAIEYVHGNFADLETILDERDFRDVDGILMDIGLSSYQLSRPERGFAFSLEGPLDMRMDKRAALMASDVVNEYSVEELTKIFWRFGEEKFSKRVAAAVVKYREQTKIESTTQLAAVVSGAIPRRFHGKKIHPATRTFQALRIFVNGELDNLSNALFTAIKFLKPGGRLVVIAFHSLEDRIVKQMFRKYVGGCICPPSFPVCRCDNKAIVRILTKRPLTADADEVLRNPRSRSAKMRVCEKI
jgi:16S rRNA (cytosine1402-N4)-methyltransferase